VVLDLIMPHLDGFEFLDRFRRTDAGQRTPVIIWTVKDLTTHDQARLRETAQAVVMKVAMVPPAWSGSWTLSCRAGRHRSKKGGSVAGECILIVDDNEMNVKLLRWLLEKHGYAVHTACDAQTARTSVRAVHPQLVLMDIQLPDVTACS